ncbi:TonB-dependent receptor [Sphingomonas naasensis]|uniref:TonB-dependent receptor n=1 Tax=Sphingomonas naasensis TaxID=1344951 RepID=A0A4S1WT22_9SPHN|nr:TonB-dependent receptor [Sphingomonas naasensis]NIJ19019.1 TonB-dependent receptor [Sphingomonas naasensis]TGX46223.1 TonB-dependent receptor [Sphingomonas naasensis]
MSKRSISRVRIGATASWTVLGLLLACGGEATAQTAPDPNAQAVPADDDLAPGVSQNYDEVVVVGSRASQQSANARKKNARTATDSIVADDIGSFPDRNVNEAISRIPGVALSRNEFGEGDGVAVRGNGADLTRVELDGIGVQSTNGLAIASGQGRSADLRELPAELIKSVDVVKGSTADMTEGSLGGTVQIKTRSGLDFKKPYFSLRAGVGQNSLGRNWTPDFNGVAASKFLDDRLGVIVSGTYSKIQNNGHGFETTTSNNRGYSRLFDFDQSPEKTFSFNPATVGTDAADVAFANSRAPDGTTLTPRELVTLAAGATSKAQCLQIFPDNPTGNGGTVAGQTLANQRAQRILEQQTCLNQWNDYTPSLIRNFMNEQNDTRYSIDARLDYRLTDNLTIFAKGTIANRKVHDQNRSRNPVSLFNQNLNGTFVNSTSGYPLTRSVSPNAPAGYYLYDPAYGLNAASTGSGSSLVTNPVLGNVLNVVPGSIKVDGAHNVTEMTLTNNSVGIDQIENTIDTKTKYAQAGAEYRGDRLEIDLWGGYTKATTSRADMRTARSYAYGDATLTLQPNGLWDIALPSTYDETNPSNFVQLNPPACVAGGTNPATCIGQQSAAASATNPGGTTQYLVSQMPLVTPNFQIQYTPSLGESTEKTAKFDLAYKTEELVPFISRIKVGAMYRNQQISKWGNGGYTASSAIGTFGQAGYVPAVIVPTAIVRGSYRACQPTTGSSAAGGLSCNYGFVPSTNPSAVRSGVDTLTPDQLRDLFARTLESPTSEYFGDLPNRGSLPPAWQGIRTDELFAELGAAQFMNFDCLKQCMGSDGQMYDQPVTRANETIKNVYGMFDFEQRLPFGLVFNGNAGIRGVFTSTQSSGLQTIEAIRVTSSYNPANPDAAGGFSTQSFARPVTFKRSTTDWLPSVNLNLWGFDDQVVFRLYGAKTVARPSIDNLIPGGTCTVDERDVLDTATEDSFGCRDRVGNPGLKPFTAWSYNASLEWYPNKDTIFSVAYGKLDVKIGKPIAVTVLEKPFEGSTEIDPITGAPLADIAFLVPTWANGPGYKRNIWEFSVKTAYTFLPWFLKYTGVDANLSVLSSAATSGQQDPLTGDVMAPPDESKYYANASLWYDDGKLNMRVSYQYRTSRFSCITPCGGNTTDINYPGEQWTNVRLVAPGYNPGVPRFNDSSTFIDAKISYNVTRNAQIYLEGRNMTREAQTISTGSYVPFGDGTPRVMRLLYGGRRIMGGVRVQFGN